MIPNDILQAFDSLEQALSGLECDGMSRVLSARLAELGIDHKVVSGMVSIDGASDVDPHFWITFPDGSILDYRLRMWRGDRVPHGLLTGVPTGVQYLAKYDHGMVSPALGRILEELATDPIHCPRGSSR